VALEHEVLDPREIWPPPSRQFHTVWPAFATQPKPPTLKRTPGSVTSISAPAAESSIWNCNPVVVGSIVAVGSRSKTPRKRMRWLPLPGSPTLRRRSLF
jgi:hypothetical protein